LRQPFEHAANLLRPHGIILASLDSTDDRAATKALNRRFSIHGFPTFKAFFDGAQATKH